MSEFRRILVIKLKHIGDVLLATPVVSALAQKYPQAQISVLVPRGTEEMLEHHPNVHEVLFFDRAIKRFAFSSFLQAEWGLVRKLRERKFDLAIDLSGGDRGAILARVSGARLRLGYKRRKGIWGRDRLFTHVADQDFRKSVVASHADVLRPLGISAPLLPPNLNPGPLAKSEAMHLLATLGVGPQENIIVFHPTSRWMFKSWEAAYCARVAEHIVRKWECRVAFTCGPEEKELKKMRQIMAAMQEPVLDLSGKTSLSVLAGILAHAKAFIGVDSAPMHMAYALDIPTLSLFGPSDPVQWGPSGPKHRIVAKRWACQPCQRDGCFGSKVSQCLTEMTPEEVIAVMDPWMKNIVLNDVVSLPFVRGGLGRGRGEGERK